MNVNSHKDMEVWQKAIDLVESVYTATKYFTKDELYTLTSQMRRAAISIPSNIAEGRSKRTTREFMRFVSIASGSTAELETQLIIVERLGYLNSDQLQSFIDKVDHIGRMLNKLYASLEMKLSKSS